MKRHLFLELLRKLKARPDLMRKAKIFAAVGIVGFLFTGALVIWAGVSAFGYVTAKVSEVTQSPQAVTHVESLKAEVEGLSSFQPLNCWGKAQSLMAVEPWLVRPALDNLKNLKFACLEQRPAVCEGHECPQIKNPVNTAEGKTI